MSALVSQPQQVEALERLIVDGDLSALSPDQRLQYYYARCEAADLDPRAQPFAYLRLQGKLVLYAVKACTDQLTAKRNLSVQVIHSQTLADEIYEVTARVTRADGTTVDDVGCVALAGTRGEARANALMKCVTKAKRRAVLSACGLGMLDETEVSSIQGAQCVELQQAHAPQAALPPAAAPPSEKPASARSDARSWGAQVLVWNQRIDQIAANGTRDQLAALQAEIRETLKAAPKGRGLSKAQGDELRQAAEAAEREIAAAEEGEDDPAAPAPAAATAPPPQRDELRDFSRLLASVPQAKQHADVAAIREEAERVLTDGKAQIVAKACDERDSQLSKKRPTRGGDEP